MERRTGIYFDSNDNVLIVPSSQNKYGLWINVNKPIILDSPYNAEQLGDVVYKALQYFNVLPYFEEKRSVGELVTGIKGYKKFSLGRRYITLSLEEDKISITSSNRDYRGAYNFDYENEKFILPNAFSEELGKAILEVLQFCS